MRTHSYYTDKRLLRDVNVHYAAPWPWRIYALPRLPQSPFGSPFSGLVDKFGVGSRPDGNIYYNGINVVKHDERDPNVLFRKAIEFDLMIIVNKFGWQFIVKGLCFAFLVGGQTQGYVSHLTFTFNATSSPHEFDNFPYHVELSSPAVLSSLYATSLLSDEASRKARELDEAIANNSKKRLHIVLYSAARTQHGIRACPNMHVALYLITFNAAVLCTIGFVSTVASRSSKLLHGTAARKLLRMRPARLSVPMRTYY